MLNDYNTLNSIPDYNPVTNAINSATNKVNLDWSGPSQTDSKRYLELLVHRHKANPDINVNTAEYESLDKNLFEGGTKAAKPYYINVVSIFG